MRLNINTIDEYIETCEPSVKDLMFQIKKAIKNVIPEAEEAMKYGMPTFRLHGNLVHFAAYKNHIGFYPAPAAIIAFKEEISMYKTSKGAIQFPINQAPPLHLIAKIVAFRRDENIRKALEKKAKKAI